MTQITIDIKEQSDIVVARQAVRHLARQLGFSLVDQTHLATAISELARNVIQHAGAGVCVITDASDHDVCRIQVVIEDHGPGIPDVDQAMRMGFSTSKGLGAGLPGAKRLVHEFEIKSEPGHTQIIIGMTRRV
jgi:serine/threonine-protein kinase RsbT